MREQEYRPRDKKVQKMTRDGLVEENRTRKATSRISSREADTAFRGAGEMPGHGEALQEVQAPADSRSRMRDAGDRPVVKKTAPGKEEKPKDAPSERKRRRYRKNREEGVEEPAGGAQDPCGKREGGMEKPLSGAERGNGKKARLLEKEKPAGNGEWFPEKEKPTGNKPRFSEKEKPTGNKPRFSEKEKPAGNRTPFLEAEKRTGKGPRPRLRYRKEELPPGAAREEKAARDTGQPVRGADGQGIRQARAGVHAAGEGAEKPPRSRIPLERLDGRTEGKRGGRLRFEAHERNVQAGRPKDSALKRMAGAGLHWKLGEAEEDNLGVEAVHKTEQAAHAGKRLSVQRGRRVVEQPGRTGRHRQKAGAAQAYKAPAGNEKRAHKETARKWMQKRRIRQKYAAAARESAKGAATAAKVLDRSGQVIRAAAKAVPKKTVLGLAAAGVLLVALAGVLFTSCSSMLTGVQSAIIATCYVADEEPINLSGLRYSEMETDLQLSINETERDYPGYDEYLYNVGEISHNPYELLGYLSAVYDDFTYAEVEAELERLFGLQYRLSREEVVETRTREDEDGEEEEYEWRILKTTLAVRPLSEIIAAGLAPGDQAGRYGVYMQTCGNRQCFGNPFDFPWIPQVTSPYGYRVHPSTGEKDLHRGIDIGAPEGTPVMAVQDGRVASAGYAGDFGLCVVIEDGKGYQSKYAHCASIAVSVGQEVKCGDVIAAVGNTGSSTGAHLHLEALHNGAYLNPYFFVGGGNGGYRPDGTAVGTPEFPENPGTPMGDGSFAAMLAEAEKYLGYPYVWGGSSPPAFDCSGFVSWVINQSGAGRVGRQTAQGLYNLCTPIPEGSLRPGDLVFFTGTYSSANPVTHVGIYVGGGRMIHAGDPISYANINSSYWTAHFYAGGRLP